MVGDGTLPLLNEYRIEEYDRHGDLLDTFQPTSEEVVEKKHGNREESENVVTASYEGRGFYVGNINHKWDNALSRAVSEMPKHIESKLSQAVNDAEEADLETEEIFDLLTVDGIPDLIVCNRQNVDDYRFVEVKKDHDEDIRQTQVEWMNRFPSLPVHIARVFHEEPRDKSSRSLERADTENQSEEFESLRRRYNQRPATGTTTENDGVASMVTLVHYGLLEATGYDTGVISSLNKDVLAATIAAFRDEGSTEVQRYKRKSKPQLKAELEDEFSLRFGSESSKPVEVTGSVGRLAPAICAGLSVLHQTDPLEATQQHLDKEVR